MLKNISVYGTISEVKIFLSRYRDADKISFKSISIYIAIYIYIFRRIILSACAARFFLYKTLLKISLY